MLFILMLREFKHYERKFGIYKRLIKAQPRHRIHPVREIS
jgi:hypothetical protein